MNYISFIGSGNVATHLSKVLLSLDCTIKSISSCNDMNAKELADSVNAQVCDVNEIESSVNLLIISVSDDAIENVIHNLSPSIKSVVHTSGAVNLDVFNNKFKNIGVIYPLQSFNKQRELDLSKVPFLIEANSNQFEKELIKLASRITNRVELMNSDSRKYLHLAAVFANNFVNLMATEAYGILEEHSIDGSLIKPLMLETIIRLNDNHPKHMQTGPAKRNDQEVLKKHEELLKSNSKLQSLYRQLSQQIMNKYDGSEL
jgi:predicted short-subunit dehydrogenase-like oxidoreductase (DUF2520 family)